MNLDIKCYNDINPVEAPVVSWFNTEPNIKIKYDGKYKYKLPKIANVQKIVKELYINTPDYWKKQCIWINLDRFYNAYKKTDNYIYKDSNYQEHPANYSEKCSCQYCKGNLDAKIRLETSLSILTSGKNLEGKGPYMKKTCISILCPLIPPMIMTYDNEIEIIDGRHRIENLKRLGAINIPVIFDNREFLNNKLLDYCLVNSNPSLFNSVSEYLSTLFFTKKRVGNEIEKPRNKRMKLN